MRFVSSFVAFLLLSLLAQADDSSLRTWPSHYVTVFYGQGQEIFGSEDARVAFGISYGSGRPEPRFAFCKVPAQLVVEGYFEHTQDSAAFKGDPVATSAVGFLALGRWFWPVKASGVGLYADLGWGFQLSDHPTIDLDSQLNSTPVTGVGATFKAGPNEYMFGIRYLHISNAGLRGKNYGENELLFTVGIRY